MCSRACFFPCFFACVVFVMQAQLETLDTYRETMTVQDVDKWVLLYGPLCFVVGFRMLFYLALVTRHSGSRK